MNRLLKLNTLFCAVITLAQAIPLNIKQLSENASIFQSYATGSVKVTQDEYMQMRNKFLRVEASHRFGSNILLHNNEVLANQVIMASKNKELIEGLINPHLFTPSQHFFSVLEKINYSELFDLLRLLPKGGMLHAHDTALCSTDYLVHLTYKENLWSCQNNDQEIVKFIFSNIQPKPLPNCSWKLTAKVREDLGAEKYDQHLRSRFSLYPNEKFKDNNYVWQEFTNIFRLLDGLLFYAPVWREYLHQALSEFYMDGVQYMEIRTRLPVLYDLIGTDYTYLDTVRIYESTLNEFKSAHPDFIGGKLIYTSLRMANNSIIAAEIQTTIELKKRFPNLIAGYDLVAQEERGKPLIEYLPQLLEAANDIDFFFHAGETNWYGTNIDENLIDAVLLGTKRIGHGYALVKHPTVMVLLKESGVAIEVNPISNQILHLVTDLRNHPCAHYFADNYPVVISSDDPSFWRALPLSHDFYVAFLGIASAHDDLRLLKQLAINSIKYSAMDEDEKKRAFNIWEASWNSYMEWIANSRGAGSQ